MLFATFFDLKKSQVEDVLPLNCPPALQTLLHRRFLLNIFGHLGQKGLVVLHEDGVAVVPLQVQPHRPDRIRVLDEAEDSKLGQLGGNSQGKAS